MADLVNFIQTIGFPIFVALYLLIITNRALDGLQSAIRDLAEVIKDNKNTIIRVECALREFESVVRHCKEMERSVKNEPRLHTKDIVNMEGN